MALEITIDGVDRTGYLHDPGGVDQVSISWGLESNMQANIQLVDRLGAYKPAVGQIVNVFASGILEVAGTIDDVTVHRIGDSNYLQSDILVVGFEQRFSKRYIVGESFGGLFLADPATNFVLAYNHKLLDNDPIQLSSTGTLPGGLPSATTVYVRDRTADTFKISLTAGGAAIDITDEGTGFHTFKWFAGRVVIWVLANTCAGEIINSSPNIQDGAVVEKIAISIVNCFDLFRTLAVASGYIFSVTENQDFLFIPRTEYAAPFNITGANPDIVFGSLRMRTTREEKRNRQWVQLGWSAFERNEGVFVSDGAARAWTVDHPIARIEEVRVIQQGYKEFVINDTLTEELYSPDHAFDNGYIVRVKTTDTLPSPLQPDTDYYVVNRTNDTIQLSLTSGGAPIDISDVGTGTHYVFLPGETILLQKSFGVAGVDLDQDFYYSVGDRLLLLDSAREVLEAGAVLVVVYRRLGGDVFAREDIADFVTTAAVEGGSGQYDSHLDDTNNTDSSSGVAKGDALLAAYKENQDVAEFATHVGGVRPGQLITITQTIPDVDDTFLIDQVSALHIGGDRNLKYTCRAVNGSRLAGWFQFMSALASGGRGGSFASVVSTGSGIGEENPGNVTLGEPQVFFTEPDFQGKTYVRITIPISPPAPIGAFNQMFVFLQAPDDITPKKADASGLNTANVGGFTIQANLSPTADYTTDTFTRNSHGLLDGYQIAFRNEGGVLPDGIIAGVTYYVVQKTTNTFKVSLTLGGAAVDFTSNGTGTHFIFFADVSRLVPSVELIPFGPFPYDANERMITITHETPYDAEYWRVYVCSGSDSVQNPLVRADQPSPSPNVLILITPPVIYVSGAEYAPLAATFSLVSGFPQYKVDEAGDQTWNYAVEWTNDTANPRAGLLGGYDIVIEYPDGRRELNSSPSHTDSRHDSDYWPVDSVAVIFKVWLVSWRVDGRKNSIVPGVTPMVQFIVQRQAFGGAGQEYAPLVTGLAVVQSYGINGSGQRVLLVDSSWTRPSSAQFGGVIIVMIRGGVHYELTGIEPGVSVRSELNHFPTANEAVTVYALSCDTNNRKNTYQAGTTPALAFDLLPPAVGGAGTEYTSLVTSPSATLAYGVSGDGVEVYGFLLNATPPSDVTWTAWIAYARRSSDGAVFALTGPEQAAVRTDLWPIRGSETFDIYFTSVDVNGNENTLVPGTTPRVTGLTPVLQTTGKLKLFRADPTTFNTAEFEIIGAATFQTKIIVAEKISVGSILRVGGGTGGSAPSFAGQANGQIAVYNASNVLRAWMGQNGSIFGGWFGELYVGGSGPTSAPIYANASGVVIIGGINVGAPYISVQNASAVEVGRIGANIDTGFHGAWFKQIRISASLGASSKIECDGSTVSFTLVNGNVTVAINPTDHIKITDTGATRFVTLNSAQVRVEKTTDNLQFTQLVLDSVIVQGAGGTFRSTLTPTVLQIANSQVLQARIGGWGTWTGTALRTTQNADDNTTVSNPPTQAEVQAIADRERETRRRLKALIDDLHATAGHGMLGA